MRLGREALIHCGHSTTTEPTHPMAAAIATAERSGMSTSLGKLCRQGHDHDGTGMSVRNNRGDCVACARESDRRRYEARRADPKFRAYQQEYQRDHFQGLKAGDPEAYKARNEVGNASKKRRTAADPEYAKELHRKSHASTKRRMESDPAYARKRRAAAVVCVTARRKSNPRTALVLNLRNRLNGAFRTYSRGGKVRTSSEYGIDFAAICERLGPCPGVRSEWHIDHIRPLSLFDFDDPGQVREAFAPQNHQWLPKDENLSKGSSFTTTTEERVNHGGI